MLLKFHWSFSHICEAGEEEWSGCGPNHNICTLHKSLLFFFISSCSSHAFSYIHLLVDPLDGWVDVNNRRAFFLLFFFLLFLFFFFFFLGRALNFPNYLGKRKRWRLSIYRITVKLQCVYTHVSKSIMLSSIFGLNVINALF